MTVGTEELGRRVLRQASWDRTARTRQLERAGFASISPIWAPDSSAASFSKCLKIFSVI
jgi:hypothetical protein